MSMQKVSVMVPPVASGAPGAVWVGQLAAGSSAPATPGSVRVCRSGSRPSAPSSPSTAPLAAKRAAAPTWSRSRCRYQATQPEFAKDLLAAANNDRGR